MMPLPAEEMASALIDRATSPNIARAFAIVLLALVICVVAIRAEIISLRENGSVAFQRHSDDSGKRFEVQTRQIIRLETQMEAITKRLDSLDDKADKILMELRRR